MASVEHIGIPGKQVYLLDTATGYARIEVTGPGGVIPVSGAATRTTTFSSVTSATSSSVTTVPSGPKTFMGQITNATSETKAITMDLYGNWTNSTTGGVKIGTLTLPSTGSVTHLEDALPVVTANFAYYYYTVTTYTSASSAPFTLYAMY